MSFNPNPEGLTGSVLDDDQFRRDFEELHTYFKQTKLQQLYRTGNRLLAVFRTGGGPGDVRVLRWEISPDNELRYLDARGERDHSFPASQDVEWIKSTRADHLDGSVIKLGERVLINPLGGSLQILLDDGGSGSLLLEDRLEHADQSLQDCEISWAVAGELVLVDLLPYGENDHRYYVVNRLAHSAVRLDSLGEHRMGRGESDPIEESMLDGSYSSVEVNEMVMTLRHLRQVQVVVLSVNRQYIASAATDDQYRTEPPFLLQGSYRNMARMASKLLPIMTPGEVDRLIDEHYAAESQALTGAAEWNLLRLAELRDAMSEEQRLRWSDILQTFRRQQRLGGDDRDPATRVVAAIESVADAFNSQPDIHFTPDLHVGASKPKIRQKPPDWVSEPAPPEEPD